MRSRRARARARSRPPPGGRPDLTPMIDVTFQLVVFLLVVQDISQRELEPVLLPEATYATTQEPAGLDDHVFVHLVHDGDDREPRLVVKGRTVSPTELQRTLRVLTDARERDGEGISPVTLQVRADTRVEWAHVQRVLQQCADPGVRIRHVQFAARGDAEPVPPSERSRR